MCDMYKKGAVAKRAVIAGLTRNLHEKGYTPSLIYTKSDKLGL